MGITTISISILALILGLLFFKFIIGLIDIIYSIVLTLIQSALKLVVIALFVGCCYLGYTYFY
jgi:hypothetical protein